MLKKIINTFKTQKFLFSSCILLVLLVMTLFSTYYFYDKYQKTLKLLVNPQVVAKEEQKKLKEQVEKLIALPNEEPVIMTVTNRDQLASQPFFAKAKNGDKVLVFNNAKKAILFDPLANKILEMGPLILPSATPSENSANETAEQAPTSVSVERGIPSVYRIALYNGTTNETVSAKFENMLKMKIQNSEITTNENAQNRNNPITKIIDLTNNYRQGAEFLASNLGGSMSGMPKGEKKPENADFLIIIGEDFLTNNP